ncbi:uncharacterized protein LOC131615102 [Vicia villosa]|uniref:uncharacterized protein LOC131615102 n=1 Tax=Vicia villosa TaxID=3911 RepID=UPI00273C6276|nr:uncharacterized protein LOC131615102 [Vicia villosa]
MAPPKPPNPSSKEILEEALQMSSLHLNNAMAETQEQMDVRFAQVHEDISKQVGQLHTRLENDKVEEESKYQALMAALQKISLQKEQQAAIPTHSAHSGGSTSGIQPSSLSFGSPTLTHVITPTHSPITHTATPTHSVFRPPVTHTFSPTQPTISTPPNFHAVPPPPHFIPYPPYTPQSAFVPITQPDPYHQLAHIPPLPPLRSPKLELPLFDGSNPLEWLFQADQFFSFYNLPPENRLSLISFYMKGDALGWFKWMHQNRLLTDWVSFTRALELRFGPSTFENHQAELFKLKQTGSVMEYQTKFEQLGNQVVGLPAVAILNCFISGLHMEIQNELAIHKPTSISQAIGLAKLIESKLKESKQKFTKPFSTFQKPSPTPPTTQNFKPHPSSAQPNLTTQKSPNQQQPKFPIRKLTQAQLQERRAQGLCFNCDEKFITGHRCSTNRFFILLADEEGVSVEPENLNLEEAPMEADFSDTYFQLSPQALTGHYHPQTLKFKGKIHGLTVMVLVDTGSTHNIMQPRIAQHLNLPTTPINQFSVMVGNGSHLQCEGICNNVQILLQNKPFTLPFYLLPIEGADIVLGMAWLRTLGPIQADFSIPSLTFQHQNTPLTLTGDPNSTPINTSFHQLRQLIHTDAIASFHLLIMEPIQNTSPTTKLPASAPPNQTLLPTPLTRLLTKFQSIFQQPKGLPPPRPHDHHINLLPNTPPINVKPYRYPHSKKETMTKMIQEMLQEGTIIPSTSPFSSPVLLVKKKDGTWRFCVDYRALNAVTVKDRFPIPTIDELLDELSSATIFSKIDLCSGYHQIRLASKDTYKTAFRTFDGHYEFLVMPFGLTNGPSTFQSAMNDLLRPFLRKFVLVFFDDILIYSANFEEHLTHLQVILELLQKQAFFVKLPKCVFAARQIEYLGHIISKGGVAPDTEKVKAILDWPTPRSLSTLRGFLGLTGFYRRFVKGYATLAAPLTDLLRSTNFNWSTEAAKAFTELKQKMTDMPVLALPDFTKEFSIETDASGVAIGAVLSQEGHPIAFFSKKMCPRMQASSVYVREMFAITESVKKWRQYLIGQRFHIYTDQKSLRSLLLQRIQTPEQERWTAKLQGFDFDISYKPGKSNLVADALSRKFEPEPAILLALSSPLPDLLHTLKHFYKNDTVGQNLLQLATQKSPNNNYSVCHGLLYYKQRLFIPDIAELRQQVLLEYHQTPTAGHSGVKATLARLRASFCWPGVYLEVKNMIKQCSICQHNKYDTQKKKGLLQPLPIPKQVWEEITMDFITHLPSSCGHTTIWVICDRLSKFVHFIPLPNHFSAKDLANRFTVEIFRLHGAPKTIVSDRDPLFLSKFWKEFFKNQGTSLQYSTSYHPETDGQTEVVNRSVETYLRCFAGDHPRTWHKFLHLAEYWYNTSFHSAIQMAPFKALYGRDPPSILDYVSNSVSDVALEDSLQQQQQILNDLKIHLQKSRVAMEKQANMKRRHVTFVEGDWVLLKLQPYRQHTVHRRESQKLAQRYFGPFRIIKRTGTVNYLLDLPSSSRIHPIVHVSLLKAYHGTLPLKDFQPLPLPDIVDFEMNSDEVCHKHKQSDANTQTSQKANTKNNETLPGSFSSGTAHARGADTGLHSATNQPQDLTPQGDPNRKGRVEVQRRREKVLQTRGDFVLNGEEERVPKVKQVNKVERQRKKGDLRNVYRERELLDSQSTILGDMGKASVITSSNNQKTINGTLIGKDLHASQRTAGFTAQGDKFQYSNQSEARNQILPYLPTASKSHKHVGLSPHEDSYSPPKSHLQGGMGGFPISHGPNTILDPSESFPMNLEGKVLVGPGSNDKKRPNRIKKKAVWLKDFV